MYIPAKNETFHACPLLREHPCFAFSPKFLIFAANF